MSDAGLNLMHRIDKLHGVSVRGQPNAAGLLVQEGFRVARLHVVRLMKRMEAVAAGQLALASGKVALAIADP